MTTRVEAPKGRKKNAKNTDAPSAEDLFQIEKYRVRILFDAAVLGSQPIRGKAEETHKIRYDRTGSRIERDIETIPEDELAALPEEAEAASDEFFDHPPTVFYRDPETASILFFDYQIKGFFKSAGETLNKHLENKGKEINALRSKIVKYLFVRPREIKIMLAEGSAVTLHDRPLQAKTARGPRVCIAISEHIPPGSRIEFELHSLCGELSEKTIRALLSYGEYLGVGQNRGAGFGRFRFDLEKIEA